MKGARTQLKRDTGIICHFVIVSLPCDYHLSLNGAILFVARLRAMSFMDSIVFSLSLSVGGTNGMDNCFSFNGVVTQWHLGECHSLLVYVSTSEKGKIDVIV